jgi:hypothetical protein
MNARAPQPPRHLLTAYQEQVLLHKHRTGALPPGCRWTTILALIRTGMLVEDSTHGLTVTAQGQAYCAAYLRDSHPPSTAG